MEKRSGTTEIATFGTGCFWDSEAAFRRVEGVTDTRVGFMGGETSDPTYEEVCSDTTGHVEVVQVVFDPSKVAYSALLDVFWSVVDAASHELIPDGKVNQYRPVIFFHSREQEAAARASMKIRQRLKDPRFPWVIEISPVSKFYEADEHHQQFYEKCGRGYAAVPRYYE